MPDSDPAARGPDAPPTPKERAGYRLVFDEDFAAPELDPSRWLACYLPQWSSRERTRPRYRLRDGRLELRIEADQEPWSPEWNGAIRVSNLQTGCRSGPVGSRSGQHPFRDDLVVREAQPTTRLYTPTYGLVEVRLRAVPLPGYLSALWMIGFEEDPRESAEICICELKGENVGRDRSTVGYGLRSFNDPAIRDAFFEEPLPIDAAAFHTYAVDWTPERVDVLVDGARVRRIEQSPGYPMQLMLNLYELPDALTPSARAASYPKTMVVDYVRGYERV